MTKKKNTVNYTVRYSYIQGCYWMSFAAIMGFSSVFLLDCGISNTQIGIIIAIAGIISAFLQPLIAGYADRPDAPPLKKMVSLICTVILILAVLLLFTRSSRLLAGILYGACITVLQLLLPLVNSLGTETMNQGKPLNWGISRGIGSVLYAIASYALGILVADAGAASIPVCIILGFGILLAALFVFPFSKTVGSTVPDDSSSKSGSAGGPLEFFRRYPRFGIVLAGTTLQYISHILLNNFTFQIVQSKGGGSPEMGVSMAISAFIELPTLFLFTYMVKKVRCDIWFRLCGLFFTVKALGTLLAPSIPVFYGIQIFQMLGWGLMTVSSVYYVNAIMKEQDAIKGQAYMTMTYTFGSVLGALIGGPLIDIAGVNAMLIFATVSAFAGMLIVVFAAERTTE